MGTYIDGTDVENYLSPAIIREIFDDTNLGPGVFDASTSPGVLLTIDLAEGQFESWNKGTRTVPLVTTTDRLAKTCCLELFGAYAFERHAELVRSGQADARRKRVEAMLLRISEGLQQLPDEKTKPGNIGGVVYSAGPRVVIDQIDGTTTRGDF
jgi:hypothetical protein